MPQERLNEGGPVVDPSKAVDLAEAKPEDIQRAIESLIHQVRPIINKLFDRNLKNQPVTLTPKDLATFMEWVMSVVDQNGILTAKVYALQDYIAENLPDEVSEGGVILPKAER